MKSIKWRFVILFIILVMIVMLVSGVYIVFNVQNQAYSNVYQELKSTADVLIKHTDITDKSLSQEQLTQRMSDTIKRFGSVYTDKKVYMIRIEDNEIINPSNSNVSEAESTTTAIALARNGNNCTQLYSCFAVNIKDELVKMGEYAEGIRIGDKVEYIISVKTPLRDVDENMYHTKVIIVTAVGIAIILSSILGIFFSGSITHPIMAMTAKAKQIANGDLSKNVYTIDIQSDDEIGALVDSFNYMSRELNKTLSQISSEKNKLETVFTHMADGILVFDNKGKVVSANPKAYHLLGSIAGKDFNKIFEALQDKIKFEKLLTLGKNSIMSYRIPIKNKHINACFATYMDKGNESVGLVTVLQDITEQEKLEAMRKEFVANVSHELRTPINTIKNYTETLIDGAIDEKEIAYNFLEVIDHESDRMTSLVEDLLELSRLDNKQIKFNMQPMNLNNILKECLQKYKIHADKKNQTIVYAESDEEFIIRGDTLRVEQVIKNIISNAVKYSQEKATVSVSLVKDDNDVEVIIADNGMGIPAEDIPRIFERFYRVDKARSRAMGGTGLGLAIAKEIMECHKGEIRVESIYEKGTTFYLKFPLDYVS